VLNITTVSPTSVPSSLLGNFLQVKAEIGAMMSPAIDKARAMSQRKFSGPRRIMKVRVMAVVTKDSARLTEPMAFLESDPVIMRLGVHMGPHPPPPIASMRAAKNPRVARLLGEYRLVDSCPLLCWNMNL